MSFGRIRVIHPRYVGPMAVPRTVLEPSAFRAECVSARARGQRVAFVPTMGALHEGHLALVHAARAVARLGHADLVFAPDPDAMYPAGDETRVRVTTLAEPLCGPFRPGHFEGVATVVTKLFALTGACVAVFGEKDYQQLAIIRRLVADLFLPVVVVGHPIVREADGLAMSSRNAYLSSTERERALGLSRGLRAASASFDAGERDARVLRAAIEREVVPIATSVDYVDIVHPDTLVPWRDGERVGDRAVAAIACRVGRTRLIDNTLLGTRMR